MRPAMHPQYRSSHPQMQGRPNMPARLAGGHGPMVGPNARINPNMAEDLRKRQLEAMANERREAAQKDANRASVPTDVNMPEGAEDVVIGDSVRQYKRLREFERKLDAMMMRKDLEYQERIEQPMRRTKKMRIWISNTAENQPWQGGELDINAYDFKEDDMGPAASFKVKIVGRLLEDEDEDELSDSDDEGEADGKARDDVEMGGAGGMKRKSTKSSGVEPTRKRMSHFFERITIDFDRAKDLQPDGANSIEWNKPQVSDPFESEPSLQADFDSLEFERKSDENINVTINLFRDELLERYALSEELAYVVGEDEATRGEVLSAIWQYAKAMDLQQDDEKRLIQCDDRLKAIFKTDILYFPNLPQQITQIPHLAPLKPISIPYTIRVDPEFQASPTPTIYDVLVPCEDFVHERMAAVHHNPDWAPTMFDLRDLDRQLALTVQAINQSKSRHSFFASMSKDPVRFLTKWGSSQKRDMEIILGEMRSGLEPEMAHQWVGEEFRRGGSHGVWGTQGVRESVGLMLNKGKRIRPT